MMTTQIVILVAIVAIIAFIAARGGGPSITQITRTRKREKEDVPKDGGDA